MSEDWRARENSSQKSFLEVAKRRGSADSTQDLFSIKKRAAHWAGDGSAEKIESELEKKEKQPVKVPGSLGEYLLGVVTLANGLYEPVVADFSVASRARLALAFEGRRVGRLIVSIVNLNHSVVFTKI